MKSILLAALFACGLASISLIAPDVSQREFAPTQIVADQHPEIINWGRGTREDPREFVPASTIALLGHWSIDCTRGGPLRLAPGITLCSSDAAVDVSNEYALYVEHLNIGKDLRTVFSAKNGAFIDTGDSTCQHQKLSYQSCFGLPEPLYRLP